MVLSSSLLPGPVEELETHIMELLKEAARGVHEEEPLENLVALCKTCSTAARVFNTEQSKALKEEVDQVYAERNAVTLLQSLHRAADALLSDCSKETLKAFALAFEAAKPWVVCGGDQAPGDFDMEGAKVKMLEKVLPKLLELHAETLAPDEPVTCPQDVSVIAKSLHQAALRVKRQ